MHTPTDYTASTTTFKYPNWGLYSYTSLDPEDDMTMWTIQEYCDATDSWAVRVAKLSAPPPATPTSISPASIPPGRSKVSVIVTGASVAGSGFYDPGPGFAKHLSASVTGGVLVKRVTYHSPTAVTLDLDTTGASSGFADLTIVNPDDQSITAEGFLSIFTPPAVRIDPPSGGQIRISWTYPAELAATVTFQLEQSSDLVSWLPVSTIIANPTPGHYQIVVPLSPALRQYYRVGATAR
jgi:hypothetical protein